MPIYLTTGLVCDFFMLVFAFHILFLVRCEQLSKERDWSGRQNGNETDERIQQLNDLLRDSQSQLEDYKGLL